MKRSFVITATALVAVSGLVATQTPASIVPAKKGTLQTIWVEPSPATCTSPASLCVSAVDPLRVDKVAVNRLSHRFVVKIYWSDPAAGTAGDSSLGQYAQPLGTLQSGQYAILIMSFYKGRLVDFKSMIFQVH
jgi:hypothetical protein